MASVNDRAGVLFSGVRGRKILRSSDARSCIDRPWEARGWLLRPFRLCAWGLHVVVPDGYAGSWFIGDSSVVGYDGTKTVRDEGEYRPRTQPAAVEAVSVGLPWHDGARLAGVAHSPVGAPRYRLVVP